MDFKQSETMINLMRSFAGESQARNRYDLAASIARDQNLYIIEQIFRFTANQEREHAQIFYKFLKEEAGNTIHIEGGYPIDLSDSITDLLKSAQHNEYEEHDDVYKTFGDVAAQEGFSAIAFTFQKIAVIEKLHGNRFGYYADLMEQNKLFSSDEECEWMCLNCGHIHKGKQAPGVCPVCQHDQGYFIRTDAVPFGGLCLGKCN